MPKSHFLLIPLLVATVGGCGPIQAIQISSAMTEYRQAAPSVRLGDPKDRVVAILEPTQKNLNARQRKSPDSYLDGNATIDIYYFRSGWQSDGLTTDDEFTPYVFRDGKLIAIGWAALGGPKSQGQAVPQFNVQQHVTVN